MEENNESIKSEVVEDQDTLRIGRKSSVIHEEGVPSHNTQSLIEIESDLKESGEQQHHIESPIKENSEVQQKNHREKVDKSATSLTPEKTNKLRGSDLQKHDNVDVISDTYRAGEGIVESQNNGEMVKPQKRESRPSSHNKSNIAVTIDGHNLSHHITDGGFQ